mgnify:CR=1 FL=1
MTSVKNVMDNLDSDQRQVLMHAFNNELPQFVKLPKGQFIGVNIRGNYPNLKIESEVGVWSIGTINGGT